MAEKFVTAMKAAGVTVQKPFHARDKIGLGRLGSSHDPNRKRHIRSQEKVPISWFKRNEWRIRLFP